MVEFCTVCGTSLPKGDLTIRGGNLFTSHDYMCPHCNRPANCEKNPAPPSPDPDPLRDLVFKRGQVQME